MRPEKAPARQAKETHTVHFIQRIFNPVNQPRLKELVNMSLDNIKRRFFESATLYSYREVAMQEIEQMRKAFEDMPHTQMLSFFFGLLNIDIDMKEHIITTDVEGNNRKLTRFYIDLNRQAVSSFFSSEKVSAREFVDACEELYVLA